MYPKIHQDYGSYFDRLLVCIRYGERVTICHASLSSAIRCDRAGNTFASVVALIFGLFLVFGILVLREVIFTEELIVRVSQRKCIMMGQVTTWTTASF